MTIPAFLRAALDRLLPGCCAMCGADGPEPLCAGCGERLLAGSAQWVARCACCAIRLPPDAHQRCHRCVHTPPSFDRTLAVTDYVPPVDRLILDLKFRAQLPLAAALGGLLARLLTGGDLAMGDTCAGTAGPAAAQQALMRVANAASAADRGTASATSAASTLLLLPVPLSTERLAERGFNQALELARPLANTLRLPITADACARIRDTAAQASLPMSERRVNMRSAFAVLQPQAVAGKGILVVDDVMTTGHTLDALAACLKRHGATHVCNLVIARTPAR